MIDNQISSKIELNIGGMQLSQEEIDRLEVQAMLDSLSSNFDDLSFPEDEIDEEFLDSRNATEAERKKPEEKEDRSASRSSMDFASDIVTAEDYDEGPQRMAFEALFAHSRNCFNKRTSEKRRISSLTWVFVPNTGNIPFDLCCEAVGVRPNLLRIRIQYELHQKWIVLSKPIHFLIEPLPSSFEAEILYNHSESELKVAKKIWGHPSVSTQTIVAFCRENHIENPFRILARLEEVGSIANQMDNWYFVGRNPQQMGLTKRNNFNWAALAII